MWKYLRHKPFSQGPANALVWSSSRKNYQRINNQLISDFCEYNLAYSLMLTAGLQSKYPIVSWSIWCDVKMVSSLGKRGGVCVSINIFLFSFLFFFGFHSLLPQEKDNNIVKELSMFPCIGISQFIKSQTGSIVLCHSLDWLKRTAVVINAFVVLLWHHYCMAIVSDMHKKKP